jgi:hypothetical protein
MIVTAQQQALRVGDRVMFIASGKGARMDRINGQRVTGTITSVFDANHEFASDVIVAVDQSSFSGTLVPLKKLRRA